MAMLLLGTKLQWSSAITLAVFIWLFCAFWAAMPLIGWGEYDYEPLRTCCTLDYSKGDRCGSYKHLSRSGKRGCGLTLFCCTFLLLNRNYVSYLIPMAIFNMVIQVFVVMSSYQSIAEKFKKTGNPRVSEIIRISHILTLRPAKNLKPRRHPVEEVV